MQPSRTDRGSFTGSPRLPPCVPRCCCVYRAVRLYPLRAMQLPRKRKVVVVTFRGGARDEETFAPEGPGKHPAHQVVNHGILGHYVTTASLATGAYETLNNFASIPPENPTVFEYYRRDLRRTRG